MLVQSTNVASLKSCQQASLEWVISLSLCKSPLTENLAVSPRHLPQLTSLALFLSSSNMCGWPAHKHTCMRSHMHARSTSMLSPLLLTLCKVSYSCFETRPLWVRLNEAHVRGGPRGWPIQYWRLWPVCITRNAYYDYQSSFIIGNNNASGWAY